MISSPVSRVAVSVVTSHGWLTVDRVIGGSVREPSTSPDSKSDTTAVPSPRSRTQQAGVGDHGEGVRVPGVAGDRPQLGGSGGVPDVQRSVVVPVGGELALDDPTDDTPTDGDRAPFLGIYLAGYTVDLPAGPATFTVTEGR